jgi:hypothetical protein
VQFLDGGDPQARVSPNERSVAKLRCLVETTGESLDRLIEVRGDLDTPRLRFKKEAVRLGQADLAVGLLVQCQIPKRSHMSVTRTVFGCDSNLENLLSGRGCGDVFDLG